MPPVPTEGLRSELAAAAAEFLLIIFILMFLMLSFWLDDLTILLLELPRILFTSGTFSLFAVVGSVFFLNCNLEVFITGSIIWLHISDLYSEVFGKMFGSVCCLISLTVLLWRACSGCFSCCLISLKLWLWQILLGIVLGVVWIEFEEIDSFLRIRNF